MSITIRNILVGLHGEDADQPTLHFAEQLARLYEAEVTARKGTNADSLLEEAARGQYDLIVVPWTGEPRSDRMALRVAGEARTSVLVVKGHPDLPTRLLVCTGGRPIAEPVIRAGAELAQVVGSKVTLLHVASAIPAMYSGLGAMEESIEELMSRDTPEAQHLRAGAQILEEHDVEGTFELRHGATVEEILRSAQLGNHDLVVIGASDSAPRFIRLFFEQVAERILELSPGSVLVVRSQEIEAGA